MVGSAPCTSTLSTLGAGWHGLEGLTAAGQGWVHGSGRGRGPGRALTALGEQLEPGEEQHEGQLGEEQHEGQLGEEHGEQHGEQLLAEQLHLGLTVESSHAGKFPP